MKKTLILSTFILAAIIGNGQMYLTTSGGISSVKNKPFVTIGAGYKLPYYCVGGELEMRVVVTNYTGDKGETPANPAHFGGRLFVDLHPFKDFHILPATGFYYRLVSADVPSLNGWDLLLGGRVIYKFVSLEYANLGKYSQTSIGVVLNLSNN